MNSDKRRYKKRKVDTYFAPLLVVVMLLQMLSPVFGSKGNNSRKFLASSSSNKVSKKENRALDENIANGKKVIDKDATKSADNTSNNSKLANTIASLQAPNDLVIVRHGFTIDGSRIEGSVRLLLPELTSLNGGAIITGDMLTPGIANLVVGSNVKFNGVVTGTGSTQPSSYSINLNTNAALAHLVTRTDAIVIDGVASPPRPKATRDVVLSQGQSPGDFTTIRNLSLNSNYGSLSVPPGIYGSLSANNATFVLGVAGQSTTYNLQGLNLSNNAQVQILGAVTINVEGNVMLSSQAKMGVEASPVALALNIANGNLSLDNSSFYGAVKTPNGQVSLSTSSLLKGLVTCNTLSVNSNSKIQGLVSDTTQPTVSIVEPTAGQVINTTTTIVTGSFQDSSLVTTVNVNGVTATINNSNYTATIPLTNGSNTITVTVTDVFGNVGTSIVNVTANTIPNQAPVVNAGTDQTITLPTNNVTLNATVTDDGLPEGVDLTVNWTKVSSPAGATVTFSSPSTTTTQATFSQAGTYVLQLEANDTKLSASDTVTITINEAQQNLAPVVSAGTDKTVTLPSAATLAGTVSDDGLPQGADLSISWSKVSGSGTVTFSSPNTATTNATFSQAGTYVLRLTASDTALTNIDDITVTVNPAQPNNTAPVVSAGADKTITLPSAATLAGTVSDDGLPQGADLSISWSKVSGSGTVTFSSPNTATTNATFSQAGTYVLRLSVSDTALTSVDDTVITVNPAQPDNNAPVVNAGQDQSITLPNPVTLQGQVSDDGKPSPPGQLTLSWSKVDGPGVVNFTNPNGAITQASVTIAGTYTLRLTANDSALSSSDNVVVIFNGTANQPPTVSAGADMDVLLPAVIKLTGQASDDGLPLGSNISYVWSKVSGPSEVSFSEPNSLTTFAVFDLPGVYRLKLTASDGQLSSGDEIELRLRARKQMPIYSNGYGFEPDEMTTKAGEKTLLIHNRTGLDLTYVFTQSSQNLSVLVKAGENAFIDATLEVGTATITVTGHPEWTCTITLVP